jgi:hypothetical protein
MQIVAVSHRLDAIEPANVERVFGVAFVAAMTCASAAVREGFAALAALAGRGESSLTTAGRGDSALDLALCRTVAPN